MRARVLSLAMSLVLGVGAVAVSAAPATAADHAATVPRAPVHTATGDGATVFALTNAQRAKAGLKPLISDLSLDEAAQVWAQQLAKSCTFTHSSSSWRSNRTASAGWASTGENIAWGYTTPSAVVTAWMKSSGHKANILGKSFTGLGVGFASGCSKTYWVQIFGLSKTARTAGAGDVNGDFNADVLAQDSAGRLLAYRGSGTGGWNGSIVTSSGWSRDDGLVTMGDFTGDGIADVGRVRANGAFELLKGTGSGTYSTPTRIGKGWGSMTAIVGGADFDGDGRTDVIARTAGGALLLYRGNGAGGWFSGSKKIGSGWGAMTAIFYAGDFNGDGKGDLMARRSDATLWLYPTNGKSGWGAAKRIGTGWRGMTAVFSPGDFDGSGKPDVLARTADGSLILYRGNGKGGWGKISVVGDGWESFEQIG